jgi:hypothetical protein
MKSLRGGPLLRGSRLRGSLALVASLSSRTGLHEQLAGAGDADSGVGTLHVVVASDRSGGRREPVGPV